MENVVLIWILQWLLAVTTLIYLKVTSPSCSRKIIIYWIGLMTGLFIIKSLELVKISINIINVVLFYPGLFLMYICLFWVQYQKKIRCQWDSNSDCQSKGKDTENSTTTQAIENLIIYKINCMVMHIPLLIATWDWKSSQHWWLPMFR